MRFTPPLKIFSLSYDWDMKQHTNTM